MGWGRSVTFRIEFNIMNILYCDIELGKKDVGYKYCRYGIIIPKNKYNFNGLKRSGRAIVMLVDDRPIGIWKFNYSISSETIKSISTWTKKEYQKRGVAFFLWKSGLQKLKPKKIKVETISIGGLKLVNKLKLEFPNIEWIVKENLSL